jgi:membrane protein implicated in regulation of membrane protease activity
VFLRFGLLSIKGISILLIFLVGFGGLILVGFLIVAPNGIETRFVASIIIIFPLPIFGTWNCLIMFLSLVILAYIL